MKKKESSGSMAVFTAPLLVGLGLLSVAGLGLTKKSMVSESGSMLEDKRGSAAPVRYDLAVGQTLNYSVKYTSRGNIASDSPRTKYAIEGSVQIIVTGRKDNGDYMLDLSTSVVSFYSEDERQQGLTVDKDERIKVALLLKPEGSVEFDKAETAKAMNAMALGQVHARVFRAAVVLFPVLPKGWTASPLKDEEGSWGFSYDCVGPVVLRGEQHAGDKNRGVFIEVVSAFAEGAVQSGHLKHVVYIKGEIASEAVLEVRLDAEKEDKAG